LTNKFIIMLRKLKYILPFALLVISASSCIKNGFDINVDPNNPTNLPVNILLPTIQRELGDNNSISGGIGGSLEVYVHRLAVREQPNGYGITGTGGIPQSMWDSYYQTVFTNADIIIDNGTKAGNFRYAGIAKIIKAYAYSQLVDVFGDIPFSEASKLVDNVKNPKFDDDATIYPKLITLIDDGIANVRNTAINPKNPAADDLFYGGNVTNWVKLGNTLKLKLYTQQRKVKNVSADVSALLASPSTLLSSTTDNFQLSYTTVNKNPGYNDYGAAQRTQNTSPWFYEILKGYNASILTANPDPRVPYYFYNQIKLGQTAVNDNNFTEYRDGSFVSIYFGSNGPDVGRTQQNTAALLGIYPVGGKFDNGAGSVPSALISLASATGAAPVRLLTYADRLFLEAELINTGVITGDAKVVTLAAVAEAFKQVDAVVTKTGTTGVPVLVGSAGMATYMANFTTEYDAASTAKKLELIMTQKWISTFGSAIDSYTDYRRTGFPILFDPRNPAMAPGGFVQPPINGNPLLNPQAKVPVSLNRDYPLSLPWPSTELTSNSSAPAQKQPSTFKVFWQP
jgi:Starch-binding associating with outer membrane